MQNRTEVIKQNETIGKNRPEETKDVLFNQLNQRNKICEYCGRTIRDHTTDDFCGV